MRSGGNPVAVVAVCIEELLTDGQAQFHSFDKGSPALVISSRVLTQAIVVAANTETAGLGAATD